ncbi:glycosyltransferase family 2 protein [Chthonobacter rhizosphaerae]|uniref:glycosyltransferase family 2 protein n=1 Tax=Chthonobacter rhizosphaerae TaxID=2735553 RepID=UPI0015EFD761|nr:glycosyltransferase family 2 protein [Chthonobacter rhizosphaerae]
MHKLIIVTPAGRERYLRILARYILADDQIAGWMLLDNCRQDSDRKYIHELARQNPKVTVRTVAGRSGEAQNINQIYQFCNDPAAFYIKMDDDIVYTEPGFARSLYAAALAQKDICIWVSPLVINNAICSFHLKYFSNVTIDNPVSAQAGCGIGWQNPGFAAALHAHFLKQLEAGLRSDFVVPSAIISSCRFSINCIGFFGDTVQAIGSQFCPPNVDHEEWLSAVLPLKQGKLAMLVGDVCVAHFAYYTQEEALLRTNLLSRYDTMSLSLERAKAA